MKNNYNAERISRKAEVLQWTGENTEQVMMFLLKHRMIGNEYRADSIMVRKHGFIVHTLYHTDWLVEGEDSILRFYKDEKYRLMYQPINDEFERLRAFALEIIDLECPGFQRWQKECIAEKHGITAESLKVPG